MSLDLPLFRDGEKLSERHLFDLAWFAVNCSRWTGRGERGGFVAPVAQGSGATHSWNWLDVKDGKAQLRPLYLLHEGFPLVVPVATPFDRVGEQLFARLWIARASAGAEVGYRVEFVWDDDSNSEGRYATVVLLARRTNAGSRYDLVPPARTPEAVPELNAAHADLIGAVARFRKVLVEHSRRVPVDRELLMDRLERLAVVPAFAPTEDLLTELRLTLRAARGFFYRVRYCERPDAWPGRQDRLVEATGAVLEHELDELCPNPVDLRLPGILTAPAPGDTAADQCRFVQAVADALDEAGDLGRLLTDSSIPASGEFLDITDHVIRRYDCAGQPRVMVELIGERRGNPRAAFADHSATPPKDYESLQPDPRPDGRRIKQFDCTARYLFVAAHRETIVRVTPEVT